MVHCTACVVGDDGACVPVTQTTARTCCEAGNEALVDGCCRLWRPCWTTAHDDHTLRRLPTCCSQTALCLNPYHWSVDITSSVNVKSRMSITHSATRFAAAQLGEVVRRGHGSTASSLLRRDATSVLYTLVQS